MGFVKKFKWGRAGVLALTLGLLLWTGFPVLAAEKLAVTEEACWDSSQTGVGRWKKVDRASEYRVRLYESDDRFVTSFSVSGTKADFREYIKDGYSYHFSVCAVPKSNQKTYISGDWKDSDTLEADGIGENEGKWRTYSQGKKYQREDKTYIAGQWELIRGCWYYFNQDGYAQTGWQMVDSAWYYLNKDGVMQTGWLDYEGNWYYLNKEGVKVTGWLETKPGEWYYMDVDGKMQEDTVVDGYRLDQAGRWVS